MRKIFRYVWKIRLEIPLYHFATEWTIISTKMAVEISVLGWLTRYPLIYDQAFFSGESAKVGQNHKGKRSAWSQIG